MSTFYEILRLRAERYGVGDLVPERIHLTLLMHVRTPVKEDGEVILFRTGKFAGQAFSLIEIYRGRLRHEMISSNFILWGEPFPSGGILARAIQSEDGLKSVLADHSDQLNSLLSHHMSSDQRHAELNLIYKCVRSAEDTGPLYTYHLMGVLDLTAIPEPTDPITASYEIRQRLEAKELPYNIG